MDFETAITITGVALGSASHVAAIVGVPKWLQRIRMAQGLFNVVAGNYGKAKNRNY